MSFLKQSAKESGHACSDPQLDQILRIREPLKLAKVPGRTLLRPITRVSLNLMEVFVPLDLLQIVVDIQ